MPSGHVDYCRDCGPCSEGEGDCDGDSECLSGLVCATDVGANYGLPANYDVCEDPGGSGCSLPPGHVDYCRECGPCAAGEGDCDGDSECQSGLICAMDVGASYGLPANYDVCEPPPSSSTGTCLVFVHGSRVEDQGNDWANDWIAGRNYWASTFFTSPLPANEDFVRAATGGFSRNHFIVRYDGAAAYWDDDAAGHVAREIVRASNGEYDSAGAGGRCNNFGRCRCDSGDDLYVITHSMGATVMDFILGNSNPSDPNYNHNGPYNQAAARINSVIAIGGAHRGSIAADYICRPDQQGCTAFGDTCTRAREWLQTDDAHQVDNFATAPSKTVFLTGGYKGTVTSACLPGEDDGVLGFATQYACSGNVYQSYDIGNVCGDGNKISAGFANLDTAYETHDDERNNADLALNRTRRSVADGIWDCNNQTYAHLQNGEEKVFANDIRARVTLGDVLVAEAIMVDDGTSADEVAGDGIYTAQFEVVDKSAEPNNRFAVDILASTDEGEERTIRLTTSYSHPRARLTGEFRDQVVAGNLQLQAEVEVFQAGRFFVQGSVYNAEGQAVGWAHTVAELRPGRHMIDLTLDGSILQAKGLMGPYVLRYLSLSDTTRMPNAWNHVLESTYQTKAYPIEEFSSSLSSKSMSDPLEEDRLMED